MKLGNVTDDMKQMIQDLARMYWDECSLEQQAFIKSIEKSCYLTDRQIQYLESLYERKVQQDAGPDVGDGWPDWD